MGYDGLCFGLAVVGASIHTGYPKVRIIKLMYIEGDGMENFMPCLSGWAWHDTLFWD